MLNASVAAPARKDCELYNCCACTLLCAKVAQVIVPSFRFHQLLHFQQLKMQYELISVEKDQIA